MDTKPKARGPSRKGNDRKKEKSQAELFIETARQIGADESGEEFEKAIKALLREKARQS